MSPELGEDAARRARVGGQLLDGVPPRPRDPALVAARLVGVQAQELRAAGLSIRARTEGLVMADIEGAAPAADGHSLVLTWTLRGTRHLHHRQDVRWLLRLLGPVFARPGARARQLGIAGPVGEGAVRVLAEALAGGAHLTRRQVGELLAGQGVDPATRAPIHVIRRAALEGILCIIPGPNGDQRQERYVSLEAWLAPDCSEPTGEWGGAELARRYLTAYGPATPSDFAAWSGLDARAVRHAWQAVADELVEVRRAGDEAWVLATAHERETNPGPVRLLGGFDTLILGYADRSLHLTADQMRVVNAGGGLIKPVVIADGRVVATWNLRRAQGRAAHKAAQIDLSPLPGADRGVDIEAGVGAEVEDIRRFLGRGPGALTPI